MEQQHNIDKFPGYPHYPASEDITRVVNNNGKERLDSVETSEAEDIDPENAQDIIAGTEADVTDEDRVIFEAIDANANTPDSLNLQNVLLDEVDDDGDLLNETSRRTQPLSGDDMDIPGSEDDDEDESIGSEDEENNYYSLGGDNHDALEEDQD